VGGAELKMYKVLTLTQPWATLVAIGAKKCETRSWSTSYRGDLLIHAAKGLGPVGGKRGLRALCGTRPFFEALMPIVPGYDHYCDADAIVEVLLGTLGHIIAACALIGCEGTDPAAWPDSGRFLYGNRANPDYQFILDWPIPEPERSFGDYSADRYMFLLANARALPEPIPARGALGTWEWTPPDGVVIETTYNL